VSQPAGPSTDAGAKRVRLNRFLAESGVGSRRDADELIAGARVTVNGTVVTDPGHGLDPDRDSVKVLGKRVRPQRLVYILLNKPEGVITTVDDPERRRTVLDLLPGLKARIYPVGRLDANTSGVLLLTNDGDLAQRLTHPRYGFPRTYHAKVTDQPSPGDLHKLESGVNIPTAEGRRERTLPARAKLVQKFERHAQIELTLTEGRQHQVKKMFAVIGHPVIKLARVKYGFLTTAGLPRGGWRYLTAEEVARLKAWRPSVVPAPRAPKERNAHEPR
jgi:23S rRNA pseudouridine2605 synthase